MVEADKALNIQIRQLEALLKTPDNNTCADCPGKTPRWASITFGTFVCLRCSGKCPLFLSQDASDFFPQEKFVCFIDTLMKILQLSDNFYACIRSASFFGRPHYEDKIR